MDLLDFSYQRQIDLNVTYKTAIFERRFRAHLAVEKKILIENKAARKLTSQDEAQLINYLKTTGLKVGLLFNFGAVKFGMIRRIF
jgi:GxxExxY protein